MYYPQSDTVLARTVVNSVPDACARASSSGGRLRQSSNALLSQRSLKPHASAFSKRLGAPWKLLIADTGGLLLSPSSDSGIHTWYSPLVLDLGIAGLLVVLADHVSIVPSAIIAFSPEC